MVGSVVTFVTDADESCGTDVGITDHAFSLAFLAETTDGNAPLFAAHDEIGMVLGHALINQNK